MSKSQGSWQWVEDTPKPKNRLLPYLFLVTAFSLGLLAGVQSNKKLHRETIEVAQEWQAEAVTAWTVIGIIPLAIQQRRIECERLRNPTTCAWQMLQLELSLLELIERRKPEGMTNDSMSTVRGDSAVDGREGVQTPRDNGRVAPTQIRS